MWWLNSVQELWIWFEFLKKIIEIRWKDKNIKIYGSDETWGEKHKNWGLIQIYKKLWFELQKDENWNDLKEKWWKNKRNSDLVMIRKCTSSI
jgi:hypothetical protein